MVRRAYIVSSISIENIEHFSRMLLRRLNHTLNAAEIRSRLDSWRYRIFIIAVCCSANSGGLGLMLINIVVNKDMQKPLG